MASASPAPLTTQAMLEKLVAFDTTSAKSNLALIDFVKDYLAGFGIPSRIIPYQDGAKANLLATIGDAANPGIIFSGHTDVVPAKSEEWQSDPFTLTRRDDNHLAVFARGAVNRVQSAFRTTFARVTFEGVDYTSAVTVPSMPAGPGRGVLGVNGLQPHLHPRTQSRIRPLAAAAA